MPELPEVETIVRDLAPELEGFRIRNARVIRPNVLRGITKRKLVSRIDGSRISKLYRRAKNIVVLLDDDNRVIIQLRMTGSLRIKKGRLTEADLDYVVFTAEIGRHSTFLFRDVRRLGTIQFMAPERWVEYEARIGPEPLAGSFRAADLASAIGGSTVAVKKAIMDQRKLAGVGNIYANEALFFAGIDPSRPSDTLSEAEFSALHRTIRRVLNNGIRSRGTTLRDYRTGTGQVGDFQHRLKVYGKGGRPCPKCRTELVTTHEIDGRSTTMCWRCQT